MKTEAFFNFMYYHRAQGLAHTAKITGDNEENGFFLAYLCDWTGSGPKDEGPDACGTGCTKEEPLIHSAVEFQLWDEEIDLLVLDGIRPESMDEIRRLTGKNHVKELVMPKGDLLEEWGRNDPADKVTILEEGQTFSVERGKWMVHIICCRNDEGNSLAVYHGPKDADPAKDDCLMTVRPFSNKVPCGKCRNDVNHVCAMRCSLYHDFDVCKKHNDRNCERYTVGTLLLGNVNLKEHGKLGRKIPEFQDIAEKTRFLVLPDGGGCGAWFPGLLKELDPCREQLNRYFIVTGNKKDNAETVKEIACSGMYYKPEFLTDEYGVCATGFFTEKA